MQVLRGAPERTTSLGRSVEALLVRIPLTPAAAAPPDEPLPLCARCGSRGYNVHQRDRRRVKDPHVRQVVVLRYVCKRCGRARRVYPVGFGSSRQSDGLKELCVLLYWLGLAYLEVRGVLADLGCPLSCTSIRRNVESARGTAGLPPPGRLHLRAVGGGMLRGRDGLIALRLEHTPTARSLVAEIAPGPNAQHVRWRLESAAALLARAR